ncbi:MAG TPA: SDR family NAD(P)-dependent oxidoreductase [Gemmatimonadaceae bacterium]|nr:SDR family NAD(P)-dependent oxidoreductase [Gemmatimonadaceae bacterium]
MSAFAGRRVLVTGATGFIGSHLVERLARDGAEVHALVRASASHAKLEALRGRAREWEADITDIGALRKAIAGARPEVVFHLAGDTGVRRVSEGWSGVERSVQVNLIGTLALLRATLEATHAVSSFVRAGGLEEYGDGAVPYDEAQREQPISPYSASQVAATHYCEMMQRGTETSIVTLRPALVYGPGQSTDFLIPNLITSCLRDQDFEMTSGTQKRDLLYIDDAVEAFVLAAARRARGVINVGHGVQHAVRDVAEEIVRLSGTRAKLHVGARSARARDLEELVTRNDRARALLGWSPAVTLTDGLKRTIESYRSQDAIAR